MIRRKSPCLPLQLPAQPAKPLVQPPLRPDTVQPKAAPSTTIVAKPVAPPAYRPQPTPQVLQKKSGRSLPPQTIRSGHNPAAPPVYGPQSVPKVLQRSSYAPSQPPNQSKRAPVYRPLPTPRVLQKSAVAPQVPSNKPRRQPVAPAQLKPRVPQVKKSLGSPPVFQPRPVPKTSLSGATPQPRSMPRPNAGLRPKAPYPTHKQRGFNPVIQRMIIVPVAGKSISIMSEIEADSATGIRVDARNLKEPICGWDFTRRAVNDTRDYDRVHAHADAIAQALQQADSVTVFCKLGQHRSVTSVIVYLMKHQNLSSGQARERIDRAANTGGHKVSWHQVTESLANIDGYPRRRDTSRRDSVVGNDNVASSPGRRIRESEVKEVTEQADRWSDKGEESPAFWPNQDYSGAT